MPSISEALARLGAAAAVRPIPDLAALARTAPPDCPPRWREAAELLLSVSGGRGLPVLGEYDFGALQSLDCSVRRHRWDPPDVVLARHASGRRLLLGRDGSVYAEKVNRPLARSLIVFLERIAAELLPSPARYAFSIHVRDEHDARKLAKKLRVDELQEASTDHDPCWSDERWFIVRDRVAARSFSELGALLTAAGAAGVEIGLHDGRAEAMLVEGFQPVPEAAQYRITGGIAEISIRLVPGERIEQALHYGPEGTEWAEWESGELLVQRRTPTLEGFADLDPALQEYLFARRAQRLPRFQRTAEQLRACLGARAWESLIALERDHGGLITEDDLTVWNLFHVAPLVAPGYLAETTPAAQRITAVRGEPVCQVGLVEPNLWLCTDSAGRFYTTGLHDHDLQAAGDGIESSLLKLALDEKLRRRRTEASLGAFLERETAERLVAALGHAATQTLDTFGHRYLTGAGFDLRQRKAALGQSERWHLVADSVKRFLDVMRHIADARRPVRAGKDNLSFPTEDEITLCERSGVALQDTWNA